MTEDWNLQNGRSFFVTEFSAAERNVRSIDSKAAIQPSLSNRLTHDHFHCWYSCTQTYMLPEKKKKSVIRGTRR